MNRLLRADAAIAGFLGRVHAGIRDWLTTPFPHAAGRLGLFRVLFSLFFLWHLSTYTGRFLGDVPAAHRMPMLLLAPFPWPGPMAIGILESLLVALLVVLCLGLFTRVVTLVVLVVALLYEGHFFSVDQEHATLVIAFYAPLLMGLFSGWGDTYSLDAVRARQRGLPPVATDAAEQRHVLPTRILLVLLGALICCSGIFKIAVEGTWFTEDGVLGYLFVHKNIEAAREGLADNHLAPLIATTPWLDKALQYATIALEMTFPLALLNRRLRHLYLASILVFHSVNGIWMATTFSAFGIVYGVFVDWEWLRRKLLPRLDAGPLIGVPTVGLVVGTFVLAALIGVLWNLPVTPRPIFNLAGLLDWQTIWYPVLPASLAWLVVAGLAILRNPVDTLRPSAA
jgi:hypothetical protein